MAPLPLKLSPVVLPKSLPPVRLVVLTTFPNTPGFPVCSWPPRTVPLSLPLPLASPAPREPPPSDLVVLFTVLLEANTKMESTRETTPLETLSLTYLSMMLTIPLDSETQLVSPETTRLVSLVESTLITRESAPLLSERDTLPPLPTLPAPPPSLLLLPLLSPELPPSHLLVLLPPLWHTSSDWLES